MPIYDIQDSNYKHYYRYNLSLVVLDNTLHSAYVTNTEGSALPITLEIVHADTTVTHVAHQLKIFPNETVDLVSQNKIYLLNGDALKVKADRASAFTVTVSLLDQAI